MAVKEMIPDSPPLRTVERYRELKKTSAAVHRGAMAGAGWSAGKAVTEAEYDAAVRAFLKSGTGGGQHVKGR